MKSPTKILKNKLYLAAKLFLSVKLLIITFTCFSYAYANTEFTFNPKNRIETVIGANELNRIGVVGGEIIEVIGDENKYALYWSGDWRNLFIKPKARSRRDYRAKLNNAPRRSARYEIYRGRYFCSNNIH